MGNYHTYINGMGSAVPPSNPEPNMPTNVPQTSQELAASIRASAAEIQGILAQRACSLVAFSWVLESSPGLYLSRNEKGNYVPGSIHDADKFNRNRALELTLELRDPKQPDVRATPVQYIAALESQYAEMIDLADMLDKAAA